MSDQEAQQRKGKLLEDFVAAKTKLQLLQDEARGAAKVMDGIVEFLRSGGDRGQISMGMPPEEYLSTRVAKLVADLRESHQEKKELKEILLGIGVNVD